MGVYQPEIKRSSKGGFYVKFTDITGPKDQEPILLPEDRDKPNYKNRQMAVMAAIRKMGQLTDAGHSIKLKV